MLELPLAGNLGDASAAKRTCKAEGTVTFVQGRHGKCASLNGHSWVDTGLLQKELGDEFTVECWVKPAAEQNTYADIFGNHVSASAGFVLQQNGGQTNEFAAFCGIAGGGVATPAVQLTAGRWQHVALVKTAGSFDSDHNGVPSHAVGSRPARPLAAPGEGGIWALPTRGDASGD